MTKPNEIAGYDGQGQRLVHALQGWDAIGPPVASFVIGVLPGEGIGPEVINASLVVLDAIQSATNLSFSIRTGGKIGCEAQRETGHALAPEVIQFCRSVFADHGAIFCGPGGGRFVYDLRRQFDLYCKMVPLQPVGALQDTGVLKPAAVENIDVLVIRESIGGLYFGDFGLEDQADRRRAYHCFYYDETQVARILRVAIHAASLRRKRLCIVTKPGGAPSISELWRQQAESLTVGLDVDTRMLEVDNACYQLVAEARSFDVVVAPNMFGDVLADSAALLLGSRGMSYSANFSDHGMAVYQTGHGAAYDLAGTDRANPVGQIQSLAMMLRESFGLGLLSTQIGAAISDTLAAGWRTRAADRREPLCAAYGRSPVVADLILTTHADPRLTITGDGNAHGTRLHAVRDGSILYRQIPSNWSI
jgi:3-isopropylmalate dehydrogenase